MRLAEREPSSALHALSTSNSVVLHLDGTRVLERNEIRSRSGLQAPLWRRLYILDEAPVCRLWIVRWLGTLDSNQDWRIQSPADSLDAACEFSQTTSERPLKDQRVAAGFPNASAPRGKGCGERP